MRARYYKMKEDHTVEAYDSITDYVSASIEEARNYLVKLSCFRVYAARKAKGGGYRKDARKLSVHVSTVFLSIDHNHRGVGDRVLFETMVFFDRNVGQKSPLENDCMRYCTYEEAVIGHRNMCERVRRFHV